MKTIFVLLTATVLTAFCVKAPMLQISTENSPRAERSSSVKYLGIRNDMLVFEVNLQFTDNEFKTLSINDGAGVEMYTERVRMNSFVKLYVFPRNYVGRIQFEVRGKKQFMSESFIIKYHIEEKLEISKV